MIKKILQKLKKNWAIFTTTFVAFGLLALIGYFFFIKGIKLPDWTGFGEYIGPDVGANRMFQRGKTLWDWLELLVIPIALAGGAIWFSSEERKSERKIAIEQRQEDTLQAYFDKIENLMLRDNLCKSVQGDDVRNVARARTLTVLSNLDDFRRGVVLRFLYESNLIKGKDSILNLDGGNLSNVFLPNLNLDEINLEHTILMEAFIPWAKLNGASLRKSIMIGARLRETELKNTDLRGVNLSDGMLAGADLTGANLEGADLERANLYKAKVTKEQLSQARSLKGAILPDGTKHQ